MIAELKIVSKAVSDGVVDRLKQFHSEAEAGDIESFAIVIRRPDGMISRYASETKDHHHLIAGLRYLEHMMIHNAEED